MAVALVPPQQGDSNLGCGCGWVGGGEHQWGQSWRDRPPPAQLCVVATQGHCVVATQGHCVVATQGGFVRIQKVVIFLTFGFEV